jgi:hypothetical protein
MNTNFDYNNDKIIIWILIIIITTIT